MKATILIDNEKNGKPYLCEHGLSIFIEFNGTNFLFDTGKSDAFLQNAKLLEKDIKKVDYVILSHGHSDHTGGLDAFLEINSTAKIVLKKEALQNKWSKSTGTFRDISFPIKRTIHKLKSRVIWAEEAQELIPNLLVLPNISKPKSHTFTDSFLFISKNDEMYTDTFEDELIVVGVENNKLIIFTGCAHNGVENIIQTAIDQTGIEEIELVVGGTHLNRASNEQIKKTISDLNHFKINRAAFNHCSGMDNVKKISNNINAIVDYAFVGYSYLT